MDRQTDSEMMDGQIIGHCYHSLLKQVVPKYKWCPTSGGGMTIYNFIEDSVLSDLS